MAWIVGDSYHRHLANPEFHGDDSQPVQVPLVVAERFRREQELEQKAQAAAVRRAGVQAVEACSTGQAATVQTGIACEDRDAEAKSLLV